MANPNAFIGLDRADRLDLLFRARVEDTPDGAAYRFFDAGSESWQDRSWRQTAEQVGRWQQAMLDTGLAAGDRVAIMSSSRWEWVLFDQAAQGLGLVVVPVYPNDRPENMHWILEDSGARLLVVEEAAQWEMAAGQSFPELERMVCIEPLPPGEHQGLRALADWLPEGPCELRSDSRAGDDLATIVYTSGTTGRPKGVMLSHRNILWNVDTALHRYPVGESDLFLSFLPLSHTFERTVGYYLPMAAGSCVVYTRGIPQLAEDLQQQQPTLMISVPRIFERVYAKIMAGLQAGSPVKRWLFHRAVALGWARFLHDQGRGAWRPGLLLQPLLDRLVGAKVRARLGGRLRFTVSGGAALAPEIARTFIGLGVPVIQGYGLTETSPVIAGNQLEDNVPETVGQPLDGVEARVADNGELLTRSPSIMLGYWNNAEATADMIDADGWLHTGDKAAIDAQGHIAITGRLKEIIVLANGEKVPPADMENAIALDALFEQVMVVGEGKPYLAALLVPEPTAYARLLGEQGLAPDDPASDADDGLQEVLLAKVAERLADFPGYARVFRVAVVREPWTVDNGMLTPTLKVRRSRVLAAHEVAVGGLYVGHE